MADTEYDTAVSETGSGDMSRDTPETDWESPASLDITVVGAGAIGGLLGGRFAATGASVTLVDQGAHREALDRTGLELIDRKGNHQSIRGPEVAGDTSGLGPQDLVVLGVKAYDLAAAAPMIPELVNSETVVLPVQNGIPWWYFQQSGGAFDGHRISAIDPDGTIERHIETDRILGCIPFAAATIVEPGTVRHTEGEWFPVGELDGAETARARGVAALFEAAGLRSRVLSDIRSELWLKALGNLAFNPISALTGATLEELCRESGTRTLARQMMEEANAVAAALDATPRRSIDDRIAGAEAVGDHQTSMLQDAKRGNRLEYEALLGAVIELADLTDKPVPTIEAIYSLTKLLDRTDHTP